MVKNLGLLCLMFAAAPFGPPDHLGLSPELHDLDTRVSNVRLSSVVPKNLFEYKSQLYVVENQTRRSKRERKVLVRRVAFLSEWERSTWQVSSAVVGLPDRIVVSLVEIHPEYGNGRSDEQKLADPKIPGK